MAAGREERDVRRLEGRTKTQRCVQRLQEQKGAKVWKEDEEEVEEGRGRRKKVDEGGEATQPLLQPPPPPRRS